MATRNAGALTLLEILRFIGSLIGAIAAVFSYLIRLFVSKAEYNRQVRAINDEKKAMRERYSIAPDVDNLRESLKLRIAAANLPNQEELTSRITDDIFEYETPTHDGLHPSKVIWKAFQQLGWELLQQEKFDELLPPNFTDDVGRGRYTDYLLAQRQKLDNPSESVKLIVEAVGRAFIHFARHLPPAAFTVDADGNEVRHVGRVALLETLTELPELILDTLVPFFGDKLKAYPLFGALRDQLDALDARAGGTLPEIEIFRGTPKQLADAYLGGTPLRALLDVMIPFRIKPEDRLEHWHLLAPTGWGKTQTLQHIIYNDITGPNPPALVIIEPKGDMVAALQRLKIFDDQPERLAIIDPALNPALNMFALPTDRHQGYSDTVREQVEASIIEQYGYIFSALDAEISRKQSTALAYVVKLIVSMRGNIRDFIKVLDDPSKTRSASPYREQIGKLDDLAQDFFDSQFFSPLSFGITRRSLAAKLFALLATPAFNRMFSVSENKLDMFTRLQTPGSVTLINTAKGLLKREASSLFGRYMIGQTMAAAFERVAVPERERKPAYLIIDEAGSYFDDSLEELLAEVRSMGVGVLFAHQLMSQLKSRSLKSSVLGNTSIKFAAPSDDDASEIAPAMRTSPDFLRSMRQIKGKATQFGVFIRGETPTALRLQVPFLTVENAPQMTDAQHAELLRRNQARFSSGAAPPPAKENTSVSSGAEW